MMAQAQRKWLFPLISVNLAVTVVTLIQAGSRDFNANELLHAWAYALVYANVTGLPAILQQQNSGKAGYIGVDQRIGPGMQKLVRVEIAATRLDQRHHGYSEVDRDQREKPLALRLGHHAALYDK